MLCGGTNTNMLGHSDDFGDFMSKAFSGAPGAPGAELMAAAAAPNGAVPMAGGLMRPASQLR